MDRRHFLKHSAAFFPIASLGSAALAHDAADAGDALAPRGRFQFPQGVASGDPRHDSLVFWTRCVRAAGTARRRAPAEVRLVHLPRLDGQPLGRDVAAGQ